MSPEQVRGGEVDARTDLFSFGLVLYEMATGQQAFSGETAAVLRDAILKHTPTSAAHLNPELPLKLIEIINRALQKDRDQRYQAASEMRRDLKGVGASSWAVPEKSIAVLPFANLSMDPENEFFADGITEEIINALAQIEHLHVAARTSTFFFKGKHAELRVIGERLKVRTILEGSVRRAGNGFRINAQLVNVADGYHLWSERYDREMKDVFDVQDEIARTIAERLKVTFEGRGQELLVKAGTKNLEAYELYLKGRTLLYRRGGAIQRAVECFEEAVALDPDYALACAGLADSYTVLGYYGLARPEACMPRGIQAARRAVALDPSLAEAHTALAMASLMGTWNKAEAEREFLRALELNPKYLQARDWYALFYLQFAAGRLEEGVAQARQALDCDPLSSYANTLFGYTCAGAGKYTAGVQACERAVELDSESFIARWAHHVTLHLSGRFEEAVRAGELALAMSGRHPWAMANLALTFADWGKPADAEALYAELAARGRRSYVSPSWLALAAAAVGLEDETIRHAREACEIRDPISIAVFSKWWRSWNARLRAYPRFCELLAGTGLE
jgi:serine/threonine-protein kinase